MRELGYAEGQNVTFEARFAEGRIERLPALAAQFVKMKVDVIVTGGTMAARPRHSQGETLKLMLKLLFLQPIAAREAWVCYGRPGWRRGSGSSRRWEGWNGGC
jgi:hypothetical protein